MNAETPSTSLKISMGSVTSNPMPDIVMFRKENKRFFRIIISLILVDFVLNELIIINDCHLLSSFFDKDVQEPLIGLFILFTIISIIIFSTIIVFLFLKNLTLSKISRFFYLILGILYYIFQIIIKLIDFAKKKFSLDPFGVIIFILISLTIIPRIVGFLYIKVYERTIKKIDGAKIAEEQVMFIEKVANNLDRSTVNNSREKELEKELDKAPVEEEIIFTMNNDKVVVNTQGTDNNNKNNNTKNKKKLKKKNLVYSDEVADMS